MNNMYTDLFSLYRQNTEETGFWVRKKNWSNHVAQVLRVKDFSKGHAVTDSNDQRVIAMIMDKRDNEIQDIVELSEPHSPNFETLTEEYSPNYILPQSFIDYIAESK
jgi:hypothetical protein